MRIGFWFVGGLVQTNQGLRMLENAGRITDGDYSLAVLGLFFLFTAVCSFAAAAKRLKVFVGEE